jgi:hypothetical protein
VAEFEIFRSLHNPIHYVAVVTGDGSDNAEGVRSSQNLSWFTVIPDDDHVHLGFDPEAAKAAIAKHGFYAFAVIVEERDGFQVMGL